MKLSYKKIVRKPEHSFLVRRDTLPCLDTDWHFHEEMELVYFLKSKGTRYVGNSIGNFMEGEIYLIGSNVPHLFRNNQEYYVDDTYQKAVDLILVQFNPDFLGDKFNALPESTNLDNLFEKAKRGLSFSKVTASLLHSLFLGLLTNRDLAKLVDLLKILDILSISEDFNFLCQQGVNNTFKKSEKERMARIISYLTQNFNNKIELEEIAEIANMSPNAFCRFFKKRTNKSFTQYLNEIRIDNACKLLIEGKLQVGEISFLSGFNSFTNFNRQFKSVMNVTPSEYLRKYHKEK